jgi:uncharacterized membrane protein
MIRLLALCLVLWSGTASAQVLPALFDVTGVAAGDVLNIRNAPNAAGDIIGSFPADATGVEVVDLSDDGKWGSVGVADESGWVAMQFLQVQQIIPGTFPAPQRCIGTEPFWSMNVSENEATLMGPDLGTLGNLILSVDRKVETDRVYIAGLTNADGQRTVVFSRELCFDGMSERLYGIGVAILSDVGSERDVLVGCCVMTTE